MNQVLKRNYIQGWEQLDGGLAMHFTLSSAYTRYGCWGLTDDYTNPDRNYKMQAVREIIAQTTTGIEQTDVPITYELSIAPNPATTNVTLQYQGKAQARISDVLGRTIWHGDVDRTIVVNTTSWTSGLYIAIVGQQVVKFMKR